MEVEGWWWRDGDMERDRDEGRERYRGRYRERDGGIQREIKR